MGLYIQSLENIPADAKRDYYIYLLDYGWKEPLGEALMANYEKMASLAAGSNAVVIRGTHRVHFEDEVLSWHHINGENADELLPAVLITNRNPHLFRESFSSGGRERIEDDLKLMLIPLKKFCSTTADVIDLVVKIFTEIKAKKDLDDFRIAKEITKGQSRAMADTVILERNFDSTGIKYQDIAGYFKPGAADPFAYKGMQVQKTVYPIHFEDRGGAEFERLVFAFLIRLRDWNKLEWLGQAGADGGRDIWGVYNGESYCYQCANYKVLSFAKISADIDKLSKENFQPDRFIVVCGGRVSADLRAKISGYAARFGIKETEVWSGVEFEERIRLHTPDLIERFVNGEPFPDTQTDRDILRLFAECFDRPAFTTRFRDEVSIPDFAKAITDTIEVLNTGVHRLRDGTVIRQISSRHQIKNASLKAQVAELTQSVVNLRNAFVRLQKQKDIRACDCGKPSCDIWYLSGRACQEMDELRERIFQQFRTIYPAFNLRVH